MWSDVKFSLHRASLDIYHSVLIYKGNLCNMTFTPVTIWPAAYSEFLGASVKLYSTWQSSASSKMTYDPVSLFVLLQLVAK